MLGRPCAFFTTSSGSSNPCSRAHPAHARATAGVESTSTPSRSNSKPRHCIGIIFSMIIGTGRRFFGNRLTLEETSQGRGVWGGRRGLNPRHSVPQTDALPAELLPPLTDNKHLTLLFGLRKRGSMGQPRQLYRQSERELKPRHAGRTGDEDAW